MNSIVFCYHVTMIVENGQKGLKTHFVFVNHRGSWNITHKKQKSYPIECQKKEERVLKVWGLQCAGSLLTSVIIEEKLPISTRKSKMAFVLGTCC